MKFIKLKMRTTALVTTTLIIILGIYDLTAVVVGGDTSLTVSQFLVNVGFNVPAFVFATGFVCGHLMGYMQPVDIIKENLLKKKKLNASEKTDS